MSFITQVDLGSCPSEVVERAIQSRELKRLMGRLNPKDLVLKVVGKEEYLLEEKSISNYQVQYIVQVVSMLPCTSYKVHSASCIYVTKYIVQST